MRQSSGILWYLGSHNMALLYSNKGMRHEIVVFKKFRHLFQIWVPGEKKGGVAHVFFATPIQPIPKSIGYAQQNVKLRNQSLLQLNT